MQKLAAKQATVQGNCVQTKKNYLADLEQEQKQLDFDY